MVRYPAYQKDFGKVESQRFKKKVFRVKSMFVTFFFLLSKSMFVT